MSLVLSLIFLRRTFTSITGPGTAISARTAGKRLIMSNELSRQLRALCVILVASAPIIVSAQQPPLTAEELGRGLHSVDGVVRGRIAARAVKLVRAGEGYNLL